MAILSAGWSARSWPPPIRSVRVTRHIDPLGLWRDDAPIKNYMVSTQAELDPLFFHDQNHPARKLVYMNLEEPDSIIRVSWALGCTGKFIWPIPDKGLRKRTHRIAAPTLIIWGQQDGLVKPIYAEEFRKLIRGARVSCRQRGAYGAVGTAGRSR